MQLSKAAFTHPTVLVGPTDVGVQTAQLLEHTATLLTLVGGPVLTVPAQGVHSLSTRVRYTDIVHCTGQRPL